MSNKRNSNFYVFLGKQLLKEHGGIQIHALGNAVYVAANSAENLVRNEYAVFKKIETTTIDHKTSDGQGPSKKAKLIIILEKHEDFDKNYENFEKVRAEQAATKELLKKEEKEKEESNAASKEKEERIAETEGSV